MGDVGESDVCTRAWCASAQSLHACVCVRVPALRMGTQSRQSAGVQVCTLRPCCTCVPAPCTCLYVRVCVCACSMHTCVHRFALSMHTFVSLCTWSCDMGSVWQIHASDPRACVHVHRIRTRVCTALPDACTCMYAHVHVCLLPACVCILAPGPCTCMYTCASDPHVCLVRAHECKRICLTHVCAHMCLIHVCLLCACKAHTRPTHVCVGMCTGSMHVCTNVHARSGVSGHVCPTATRVRACACSLQAPPCV